MHLEIKQVEKDKPLAEALKHFVAHFSWEEVKPHMMAMLENWPFQA